MEGKKVGGIWKESGMRGEVALIKNIYMHVWNSQAIN